MSKVRKAPAGAQKPLPITPGKIIQIAMAHSEEACIDELFLDENGDVWRWEYRTEEKEKPLGPPSKDGKIEIGVYRVYERRLVPVRMSSSWHFENEHLMHNFFMHESNKKENK